ncbi:MAG TPA: hypothetical protein VIF82_09910 [Burkholderiaceae bacterium]
MKPTSFKLSLLSVAFLAGGAISSAALATIPSTAPYITDTQNVHVQDATSEGVNQLNMVLCIMNAMSPAAMVNAGPYIALVDKNKCDTSGRDSASNSSSTSSGAGAAPNYMNAIVDVTRADNVSPMVFKAWMSLTEQGHLTTVYVKGSVTQAPSTSLPYGVFRLDYLGKVGGVTQFNGYIDSTTNGISYYETSAGGGGGGAQISALALSASSTTSGTGSMADAGTTFNFAFNTNLFRRSDGTNDKCFDRTQANADKSVWRYGTYNAVDGTRVDQSNPGFPITASYLGNSYYGFASFWGINFQGLDLNAIADSNPIAGLTVSDQRQGNSSTYSLAKLSGKLTKYTLASTTLSAIDGFPIQAWGNFYALTGNNAALLNVNQVEMHWDNANTRFVITGQQTCDPNGCLTVPLAGNVTVPFTAASFDLNGYSQSLGGQVSIPHSVSYAGSSSVNYYTQSVVIPGSAGAPTALYCLNNCVTSASLAAFTGSNSPFNAGTISQWSSGNNRVTYAFGSSGLTESSNSVTASSTALQNASTYFTGMNQQGIRTGRLFTTDLTGVGGCPNTYCEPNSDYYTWETGPNQWNQSLWLTHSGTVVTLDPPQNMSYIVQAADDSSGSWVGKTIQLQFSGFGNLWGIPGHCVDPVDNSVVACSQNVRYVPEFALADGDTMTLGSTPLIVKALDEELRLKSVLLSQCTSANLTLSSQTVPTSAGLHDPSNSSDADYIGTQPTVSGAPKVIHGVVQ